MGTGTPALVLFVPRPTPMKSLPLALHQVIRPQSLQPEMPIFSFIRRTFSSSSAFDEKETKRTLSLPSISSSHATSTPLPKKRKTTPTIKNSSSSVKKFFSAAALSPINKIAKADSEKASTLTFRRKKPANLRLRSSSELHIYITDEERMTLIDVTGGEERSIQLRHIDHVISNNPMLSTLRIHGNITDEVLIALTECIAGAKALVFEEATMIVRPEHLSYVLARFRVTALSFHGCIFEDAQLLSDRLFLENYQISQVSVSCADGGCQSFPLLTDRTLLSWAARSHFPSLLQLSAIDTSFTVDGVERLLRAFFAHSPSQLPEASVNYSFGKLNASASIVLGKLTRIDPVLKVFRVHGSFVFAQSECPQAKICCSTLDEIAFDHYYNLRDRIKGEVKGERSRKVPTFNRDPSRRGSLRRGQKATLKRMRSGVRAEYYTVVDGSRRPYREGSPSSTVWVMEV